MILRKLAVSSRAVLVRLKPSFRVNIRANELSVGCSYCAVDFSTVKEGFTENTEVLSRSVTKDVMK